MKIVAERNFNIILFIAGMSVLAAAAPVIRYLQETLPVKTYQL